MNEIISQNTNPVFDYEIRYNRGEAREKAIMADSLERVAPLIRAYAKDLAGLLRSMNMLHLPMNWTEHKHRLKDLWRPVPNGYCAPIVRLPINMISWSSVRIARNSDQLALEVTAATVTIMLVCQPSWQTYKRWGMTLLEEFYRVMRGVREHYSLDWRDESHTQTEYSWDTLKMQYVSKQPAYILDVPIPEVQDRYDDKPTTRCTIKVNLMFVFELPTPPENEKWSGCEMVEETVTKTTTRKVRKMKCE